MKNDFRVSKIAQDTYMLFEEKGVATYLLAGREKALLIDTGYGSPRLPEQVRRLTGKPLVVANTHIHPDHSAGNAFFGPVFAGAADIPAPGEKFLFEQMTGTIRANKKKWALINLMLNRMLRKLDTDLSGAQFQPYPEDRQIALGGRTVRVLDCPGHTPGSVVLLDEATKTVFAGDALGLWLFTSPAQKLGPYLVRLREIGRIPGYESIWLSHNPHRQAFGYLDAFVDFASHLEALKPRKVRLPGYASPLYMFARQHPAYGRLMLWCFADQLEDGHTGV